MSPRRSILVALAAVCMLAVAGAAMAQYTVVAVMPDGATIMRGPDGKVRSYQVPAGTTFNADGKAQHIIVNYRPLGSVMFFSRLLREKFAGTPYAEHYLAGEV